MFANYIPRAIRKIPNYECSCSNSCEAVIELLFSDDKPIKFIEKALTIDYQINDVKLVNFNTFDKEQEIRLHLISIVQNRKYKLFERLLILNNSLINLNEALTKNDQKQINNYLLNDTSSYDIQNLKEKDVLFGLNVLKYLVLKIKEISISLIDSSRSVLEFYKNITLNQFKEQKIKLNNKFPFLDIYLEHVLVNHMFYEQFPFQDRPETPIEEFMAICAVYGLLRYYLIGLCDKINSKEQLIDLISSIFRFIDHTDFDRFSITHLKELKCDSIDKVINIIII